MIHHIRIIIMNIKGMHVLFLSMGSFMGLSPGNNW
uniref:Uncharacterized protein n=1 Tax=Arundo donax TaxID=35708 RepID=A0A0A9ACA5_ARUDO